MDSCVSSYICVFCFVFVLFYFMFFVFLLLAMALQLPVKDIVRFKCGGENSYTILHILL